MRWLSDRGQAVWRAYLLVVLGTSVVVQAADWPQFRGPARDGKAEATGLLRQWPEGGPELLWTAKGLGAGFASVAVVGQKIYTSGLEGDGQGYVYAYDTSGQQLWKAAYGPEWDGGYPGARTTPTVDEGRLYVISGHGRVVCLAAASGEVIWAVDTQKEFGAQNISFGMSESLLVDGPRLICTPGGEDAAIVALDKKTGKTVWVCREIIERSAYCSPIILEAGTQRLIVTLLANSLVGLDAETGKLLWQHPHDAKYKIHAVSPVHADGRIYITSGYGGVRGEMLELAEDGRSVTSRWTDGDLDCHHGGVIVHEGRVYGASSQNGDGNWICLKLANGQVDATTAMVGKGSVTFAEGLLYGYGEKGMVGLMNPAPDDFRLISSFQVTAGSGEHWAHPVVANGRLYIRHGDVLLAYNIAAGP